LFEAATGSLPFESESMAGFILHHLETPPPRVRDRVPGCPPEFDELVHQLLAKDPDARPSDAHVVVARLSEMASDGARRVRRVSVFTTENRTTMPSPIARWKSRVKLYSEMVERVHGDDPPSDLGETLAEFHASLGRLTSLHNEGAKIERGMVDHSESLNRDRERVGHAVETLAKDLSRARETKRGVEHARAYQSALALLIDLDRHSPDAPVPKSLEVLLDARQHYERWLEAHRASGETDIAFQLAALRERLDRVEAEGADARAGDTLALTENGRERASIEERLIRHAQALGAAFRGEPRVSDLLQKLRAG
ncbi:MAG: serine/threonine protein kinase, partial [Polyangiales bacterium]